MRRLGCCSLLHRGTYGLALVLVKEAEAYVHDELLRWHGNCMSRLITVAAYPAALLDDSQPFAIQFIRKRSYT